MKLTLHSYLAKLTGRACLILTVMHAVLNQANQSRVCLTQLGSQSVTRDSGQQLPVCYYVNVMQLHVSLQSVSQSQQSVSSLTTLLLNQSNRTFRTLLTPWLIFITPLVLNSLCCSYRTGSGS